MAFVHFVLEEPTEMAPVKESRVLLRDVTSDLTVTVSHAVTSGN